MSSEITPSSLPDSGTGDMNLSETELTLGLPGDSRIPKSGTKRVFSETVDLNLGNSVASKNKSCKIDLSESASCKNTESTTSKFRGQVVGWPPVGGHRKNIMGVKFVKVAVDGAPYLRKVDLGVYKSYEQFLSALQELFTCFTIRNVLNEKKLIDPVNGVEYVPTYEDRDGDWMLVGDVPWKMFAESCKRVRLMTRSEAIGLAPRTPVKCSSSSG